MKAIIQDRYGPPDVLRLDDIDTPTPGDDDALVRVHAAGVAASVWHIMAGEPYIMRAMGFGLRKPQIRTGAKHFVPGTDFAGRVEAVEECAPDLEPGVEVFGTCYGAFAEYALADKIVPKPDNLTFEQAAAVPDSGCTALKGVRDAGEVKPGQHVLVIGAAGGVGTFAVRIAKALGAEVTGVCSTTKTKLVRSIGADHAIDYMQEDFADGTQRYDVILDTAGRRPLAHLRRALAPEGTLVIIGGEGGGRWFGGISRQIGAMLRSPFARQNLRAPVYTGHSREDLLALKELIDAGRVTPVIERTYPLSQAADALRHWAQGHAAGKTVITV